MAYRESPSGTRSAELTIWAWKRELQFAFRFSIVFARLTRSIGLSIQVGSEPAWLPSETRWLRRSWCWVGVWLIPEASGVVTVDPAHSTARDLIPNNSLSNITSHFQRCFESTFVSVTRRLTCLGCPLLNPPVAAEVGLDRWITKSPYASSPTPSLPRHPPFRARSAVIPRLSTSRHESLGD